MQKIILSISFVCLIISCNPKNSEKTSNEVKTELIKISYRPSFHRPAETILNLKEKYLIFYSPSAYIPEPLSPPRKNGKISIEEKREYENYIYERPELIPFRADLNENDVENLSRTINSFNAKDYEVVQEFTSIDGMSTNIVISTSDGKLFEINPSNEPKPMQRELYQQVLNILVDKNRNKNDSIILQKIQDYH